MKNQLIRMVAILCLLVLAGQAQAGDWTTNQFFYKPSMGARGQAEVEKFNTGVNRVDSRLGKEIFLGDPTALTLVAALTAIGSADKVLTIPAGTVAVNSNTTIPANVHLRFLKGGILQVANGVTLTINGTVEAAPSQIFSLTGTGKVVFGSRNKTGHVEWWGAKGDNSTNCTSAINAAIASGLKWVNLQAGTYLVTTITHKSPGVYLVGAGQHATTIKQSTASGVCIDVAVGSYDFSVPNAGLRYMTIQGAATSYVAGNHGVFVEDVPWGYHIENVEIKSFGGDGFRGAGSCYGSFFKEVIIRDCYGTGFNLYKLTYRHNGTVVIDMRIYGCDNGVKIDDCYQISFYGLIVEDDVNDAKNPDNLAIHIYNTKHVNFYNTYVEWSKTDQTEIILIEQIADNINFYGLQLSTTDNNNTLTQLIRLVNADYCNIYGGNYQWIVNGRALQTGIKLDANCSNNTIVNPSIKVGNGFTGTITKKIDDNGSLNYIFADGYIYPNELGLMGTSTGNYVIGGRDDGDSGRRWGITAGGQIFWGDGSASVDTNLYRAGANILKTDDKFCAVAGLGVGNSASGDVTSTSKTRKIEVFDANGNSLGYLQVYQGP